MITPAALKQEVPLTSRGRETVARGRYDVIESIHGRDKRIVLVVGQCSIHDVASDAEYSKRLLSLSKAVDDVFIIVKRVYFEKPRTTVGWKGLIYDPNLDGTENINKGLRLAREILVRNAEMGLLSGTEFLDPFVPQYLGGTISWAAIGARTVQSSVHRQMASGLSMPIGFKNSTQGDITVAMHAVIAASKPQWFLGIDQNGTVSAVTTKGNSNTHIILRGGDNGPNYDAASVEKAQVILKENGLSDTLMVDCSLGNSNKDYRMQSKVFKDVIGQILRGNTGIRGLMLESNINEGSQPIPKRAKDLKYGVSVTDSCIGWEETEKLILDAHRLLRK